MDFIELAQHCAPQISVETLAAVVSLESGFRPFAIRSNSDHPPAKQPKSKDEAISVATRLIAGGRDVGLGLGGIHSEDLNLVGLSISDAFDHCLNLQATATLLGEHYQIAIQQGATPKQAETLMLRAYYGRGDTSGGKAIGYEKQVSFERQRLAPMLPQITIGTAHDTDLLSDNSVIGETQEQTSRREDTTGSASSTQSPQWDVFNRARKSSVLIFSN